MKELPKWPHHIGFKFFLMLTAGIRRLPGVSRGHGRTRAGPGQAAGRQGAASQLLDTAVWPGSWWHCSNSCQDGGSLQNSKNFHCFSFCSCCTSLSLPLMHIILYTVPVYLFLRHSSMPKSIKRQCHKMFLLLFHHMLCCSRPKQWTSDKKLRLI